MEASHFLAEGSRTLVVTIITRWTPLKALFLQFDTIQRTIYVQSIHTFELFSRLIKLIQEVCGLYQAIVSLFILSHLSAFETALT